MRKLLQSLLPALAFALLLVSYLFSAETLHLNRRNPYFLSDLGGRTLWILLGWYALFAVAVAVPVGISIRSRRWQAFALAFIGYLLVSLKIFWVDAGMLAAPRVAIAFAFFSIGWFIGAGYLSKRLALPTAFPLLLMLAYAHVSLAIASRWSIGGGRLMPFLLSGSTLLIVVIGGAAVVSVTLLQRVLERRASWWTSAALPVGLLFAQVIVIIASLKPLPTASGSLVAARENAPDVYFLSFDALRSDAFNAFVASHPTSHLATLSAEATTFDNVVSHGPSTDTILANNTYGGASRSGCGGTVPGKMAALGYLTVAGYARLGRRFEGAECYQHYYSPAAATLMSRYAVPAVFGAIAHREHLLQQQGRAPGLIDKLRQFAGARAPLFSYLHFLELHAPYVPAHRRRDPEFTASMHEFIQQCQVVACDQKDPKNAKLIELARRAYVELLDEVDVAVGSVLSLANERKRAFVLVVTADHGELFGEHGGFAHSGGFVPELMDVPFMVYDSRAPRPSRRCELMLSSEAVKTTALSAGAQSPAQYPDHDVLEVAMPPLGRAQIDKAAQTIQYEVSEEVIPQAGTWRNIHRDARGVLAYPIERCGVATDSSSQRTRETSTLASPAPIVAPPETTR